jgi:hypothetical protein
MRGCLQGPVRGPTIVGGKPPIEEGGFDGGGRRYGPPRRTERPPLATDEGEGRQAMADQAYCMKCREKREFEGSLVTLKNGRPALQGSCPVCGTKLTKILGMDAAKAMGWSA